MPPIPVSKRAWYEEKYGKDRVASMEKTVLSVGEELGIHFKYDGVISSSLDVHRVADWALDSGTAGGGCIAQNKFVEGMFKRYFEQGRAPSDRTALLESVVEAGLDQTACEALLDSSERRATVADEAALIRQKWRVSGVPFFVFQKDSDDYAPKMYGVSGAEHESVLAEMLMKPFADEDASVAK
eukprot:m.26211 g.26211  ORF g.26211 m.26211 type:complete len:184 (+) comp13285_c0_seq3:285-836(+)